MIESASPMNDMICRISFLCEFMSCLLWERCPGELLLKDAADGVEGHGNDPCRQHLREEVRTVVGEKLRQVVVHPAEARILVLGVENEADGERAEPSDRRRPARHQPLPLGVVSCKTQLRKQPEVYEDERAQGHKDQSVVGHDAIEIMQYCRNACWDNHDGPGYHCYGPASPVRRGNLKSQTRSIKCRIC